MKILICGVGAIGSNLVTHLVPDLKGEHEITILDMDTVEERNVTPGTQVYAPDQIGMAKVEALQFYIYKRFEREIGMLQGKLETPDLEWAKQVVGTVMDHPYDLVIDCFDNHDARNFIREICRTKKMALLHVGFSDQFTFSIEWDENYQVPTDITTGLDICEMPGASAFVGSVASLGAMVAEEFIRNGKKTEILGGKMYSKIL